MLLKDVLEDLDAIDGILIMNGSRQILARKVYDLDPKHCLPSIAASLAKLASTFEIFESDRIDPVGLWAALIGSEANIHGSGFIIDSIDPELCKEPSYVVSCDDHTIRVNRLLTDSARSLDAIATIESLGWRIIGN